MLIKLKHIDYNLMVLRLTYHIDDAEDPIATVDDMVKRSTNNNSVLLIILVSGNKKGCTRQPF